MLKFKTTYNLRSYAEFETFDTNTYGERLRKTKVIDLIDVSSFSGDKIDLIISIIDKIEAILKEYDLDHMDLARSEFDSIKNTWLESRKKIIDLYPPGSPNRKMLEPQLNIFKKDNPEPDYLFRIEIEKKYFVKNMKSKIDIDGVEQISGMIFDKMRADFNENFSFINEVTEKLEIE